MSGFKREWNRISWKSRKDLVKQTVAVIVLSAVIAIAIFALDTGMMAALSQLL